MVQIIKINLSNNFYKLFNRRKRQVFEINKEISNLMNFTE